MSRKSLRALQSRSRKTRRSSASLMQHFKPALEPLEQRMLLSATVFNHWDFENHAAGVPGTVYTDVDLRGDATHVGDFDPSPYDSDNNGIADEDYVGINHQTFKDNYVVTDTINGVSTNVLKVVHPANTLQSGFQWDVDLGADRPELYLSYNFKPSDNYVWNEGGKLLGLGGTPISGAGSGPEYYDGFSYQLNFHQGGSLSTYDYDGTGMHNNQEWTAANRNQIFLNSGNWYNVTQRVVMNTFVGGVAQSNGLAEYWIDGELLFQETNLICMRYENAGMQIDNLLLTNFYGGDDSCKPLRDCYGYIDNISVWLPDSTDDPYVGREANGTPKTHPDNYILQTPDKIVDHTAVYDTLVPLTDTSVTVQNETFNNYTVKLAQDLDETYLIDAGQDYKVSYHFQVGDDNHLGIGMNDYFEIFDGSRTDSPVLAHLDGQNAWKLHTTVTSTGRYMLVRVSTDNRSLTNDSLDAGYGFTGDASRVAATALPPGNLVAAPASTTQINLTWTNNSASATDIRIERATTSDFSGTSFTSFNVASNDTSYGSSGLTEGTQYYYRVRKSDGAAYSNTVVTAAWPTTPDGLSAPAISSARINLSWNDNSTHETGYIIDQATNSTFPTSGVTTFRVGPNVNTYQSTGLLGSTTYYYRVRATDNLGNVQSPNTSPLSATTSAGNTITVHSAGSLDGFIPGSGGTPVASVTSGDYMAFSQNVRVGDTTGNGQYRSFLSFDTSGLQDSGITITGATLRLRRRDVSVGNANANSHWDINPVGVNPFTWGGAIKVDIKNGYFGASNTLESGDWGYSTGVSQLTNTMSNPLTDGDGHWSTVAVDSGLLTSSINTGGLTQFRIYYNTASNNNGAEDMFCFYSGDVSGQWADEDYAPELVIEYTTGASVPPTPDPTPTPNSTTQVTLAWSDVANETDYELWQSTVSDFSAGTTMMTRTANVVSYQFTGLTEGTQYYYRMRAHNAVGYSGYSTTDTSAAIPTTPTIQSATAAGSTQINLTWNDLSTHNTSYEVDWADNVGFNNASGVSTLAGNANSYACTGLSPSTTYYFRVRASSVSGTVDSPDSSASATTQDGGTITLTPTPTSIANDDGYVCEYSQSANYGGFANSGNTDNGIMAGDASSPADAQLKGILSFDTSGLPDDATVTSATLRLRRSGLVGTNPFSWSGGNVFLADIKSSNSQGFGGYYTLENGDWNATADATGVAQLSNPAANGDWSTGTLTSGLSYINKTGKTQFRVYFQTPELDNNIGDNLQFYSGNSTSSKPELVIQYTTGGSIPADVTIGTATANSASQITLTWTDVATETDYLIEQSTDAGFSVTSSGSAAANATSYASTGLTEGTQYYYRVKAHNASGYSANYSSQANARTNPAACTSLTAATIAGVTNQLTLTWTDTSNNESRFSVDRSTSSNMASPTTFTVAARANTGTASYTDSGLTEGTQYYYRIRSLIDAGNNYSTYYPTSTPYASATTAPAAASSLSAATIAGNTTQLTLTWTDTSNNESRFSVERSISSNMASPTTFTVAAHAGTGTTSYTDSSLTEGTQYYYRIRSLIDAGSNYSTYYPTSTPYASATTAPAAPTGMAATVISGTQINLTWTDVSSQNTAYEIDRATNAGFTSNTATFTTGANANSFASTGLTAGTTYYYRVRSTISSTNDSTNSATVQSLPTGWITADVGTVGATGTAAYDLASTTFTVEGSGDEIYGNSDECRFVYLPASGDCSIVARVTSVENNNQWSQAGVMIRDGSTISDTSKEACCVVAPYAVHSPTNGDIQFLYRTTVNGSTAQADNWGLSTPYYLRMVRSGSTFTASRSTDGSNWTTVGSQSITMGTNVLIGLVSNSQVDGTLCTATFTNVSVTTMRAAGGEMTGREVEALTQDALDPVAAAAMARWEAVLRATSVVNARVSNNAFASVEFVIADLSGDVLGMTVGSTIYIDRDAAGYGWYTDALFAKNLNFLDAKEGAGMDLLTVVSHELGHVLGLGDSQRGVMSETLEEGTRLLPSWSDVHRSSGIRGRVLAAAINELLDADVDVRHEFLKRA